MTAAYLTINGPGHPSINKVLQHFAVEILYQKA